MTMHGVGGGTPALHSASDSSLVSSMEAELDRDDARSNGGGYYDTRRPDGRRRQHNHHHHQQQHDQQQQHPNQPTRLRELQAKYRNRPRRLYLTLFSCIVAAALYARVLLFSGWGDTLRPVRTLPDISNLRPSVDYPMIGAAADGDGDGDGDGIATSGGDGERITSSGEEAAKELGTAAFTSDMISRREAMVRAARGRDGIDPRGLPAVRAWNDWVDAAKRARREERRKDRIRREEEREEDRTEGEGEEEEGDAVEDGETEGEADDIMKEGRGVGAGSHVEGIDKEKDHGGGEDPAKDSSSKAQTAEEEDDRRRSVRGAAAGDDKSSRRGRGPSRLAPLLIMVVCCSLLRTCVTLAIQISADSADVERIRRAAAAAGLGDGGAAAADDPFLSGLGRALGQRIGSGGGPRPNSLAFALAPLARDPRTGTGPGALARQASRTAAARARYRRLVEGLNAARAENGQRPISEESLHLVLSQRNFTGNDYDELLRFGDEENGPALESLTSGMGATGEEIARCPDRTVESAEDDLMRGGPGGTARNCAVCLEPYRVGDRVRTIPCFHTFHCHCIDPWLGRKAECPVCKHPALG